MTKYIIVFEEPFTDISSIGPFQDWIEATGYGDYNISGDVKWHISELEAPQ